MILVDEDKIVVIFLFFVTTSKRRREKKEEVYVCMNHTPVEVFYAISLYLLY
jgi:hypothetical protein